MRVHNLSIVSMLTINALSASPLLADEQAEVPAYRYGTQLDVARVIRIEEPAPLTCEIVRAKMTFVNTQGVTERISFLKQAEACSRE
ncbi:DUF2790 domain-containing protein [Stutzerimonas azotifigens]|uniref:DUF2790 domain-containing protein n=1 Tax=Stutzerimonas azotifigens TaxID=291995 RepID=A0ABR5YV15_9GAMM|nr:DUF2790 domain-containing protein [Stutzerimonas azotifigens]MBA1271772.1 DUF2790 domain-containing protein [Stutzerimonas azotifigens]